MQRREYRRPEVVELGKASKLTLGNIGCTSDGYCCSKFQDVEVT